MPGIYFDLGARLRTYSAATKADGTTTVKIELAITDPYELAQVLQQLAEINQKQPAHAKPSRPQRARPSNRGDE